MSSLPQTDMRHQALALVLLLGIVGTTSAHGTWSLRLEAPHTVGDTTAASRGVSCPADCSLLIAYQVSASSVGIRSMLRTFVKRYTSPDVDMAFLIWHEHAEALKETIAAENRTAQDMYVLHGPQDTAGSIHHSIRVLDQLRTLHAMFGSRYKFHVVALETTIIQPLVMKHHLLGINTSKELVYCPMTKGSNCEESFFAYSSSIGDVISRRVVDAPGLDDIGAHWWTKAADQLNITKCAVKAGYVAEGQHGKSDTVAITGVKTTEQFMAVINEALWNLSKWYSCGARSMQSDACTAINYYASKRNECN